MKAIMAMLSRVLLLVMLISLAACDSDDDDPDQQTGTTEETSQVDDPQQEETTPDGADLAFTEVPLLHYLDQEETVVIRNQQEWQNYLNRSQQYLFNPNIDPTDPPCDLSTHMLIAHSFEPHDGCPWTFTGVDSVTIVDGTIVVHGNVDSKYIPTPSEPVNDCQVVDVHSGFAVCVEQRDMPVEVTLNWY